MYTPSILPSYPTPGHRAWYLIKVLVSSDHEKVHLSFSVKVWESGHLPYLTETVPNIIIRGLAILVIVDEAYVMLGQVKPQSLIELSDITYYPKNVG